VAPEKPEYRAKGGRETLTAGFISGKKRRPGGATKEKEERVV